MIDAGPSATLTFPSVFPGPQEMTFAMRNLRFIFLALALLFTMPLAVSVAQTSASKAAAAAATAATPDNKLDINTATADQLKAFPGIGEAYSKRIIDGRPYTAKNQLVSRGVLPEGVYNKIKDSIIASKPKK